MVKVILSQINIYLLLTSRCYTNFQLRVHLDFIPHQDLKCLWFVVSFFFSVLLEVGIDFTLAKEVLFINTRIYWVILIACLRLLEFGSCKILKPCKASYSDGLLLYTVRGAQWLDKENYCILSIWTEIDGMSTVIK